MIVSFMVTAKLGGARDDATMKYVYLLQGTTANLSNYATMLPKDSIAYALTYDRDVAPGFATAHIYDPDCSWAEGRNQLVAAAILAHSDADYFIFADDDVEFKEGSFSSFERLISETRPMMGVPIFPKT